MIGGAYGWLIHGLFPWTAGPGAYAMVGMAALFAGMTQAPITGIIILFKMTQDYRIILPLMLSSVIATLLSARLSEETIYTMKLARRGIKLRQGHLTRVMAAIPVSEAMSAPVATVRPEMTLGDVVALMQSTKHNGFPVVDAGGRLVGMITLEDIRGTLTGDDHGHLVGLVTRSDVLKAYQRRLTLAGGRPAGSMAGK